MTERIFQRDTIELDATKVEHYEHKVFGPVTVFKDVPIARAIVQEYENGRAYKPGKELWDAAWTAEGRWAIAGRHPDTYVILNRDDIHGRTVNARPTKSLLDPATRRPMDRGILVDLEVFDNLVPPQLLKDMVSGKKTNVSIGFSFDEDKTPGVVEDEDDKSIMGMEFEFVQRNITIDHTAFGLEQGRCPMPLCGIGADEVSSKIVVGDPFAGYETFEECIKDIMKQNPDYTRKQASGTCAVIEQRSKEKHKSDEDGNISIGGDLSIEEINEKIKDLKNQRIQLQEKIDELYTKREKRPEDELWNQVRDLDEEISAYLQARAIKLAADYPSSEYSLATSCMCRECGYILMESPTVSIEKHCSEYNCPQCNSQMYQRNSPESGEELVQGDEVEWWQMLDWKEMKDTFDKLPEDIKSVITDAGLCPECDEKLGEDEQDDYDEFMVPHLAEDAVWNYAYKKALPDSAYAYIEPGCEKEEGKTQQRCRHMPIKDKAGNYDKAHVRAALQALSGARTGKVPPYASKAKSKVCAGARALKMESEVCGTKKKKGDKRTPDEVMAKFDRTLDDPDLKAKLKQY